MGELQLFTIGGTFKLIYADLVNDKQLTMEIDTGAAIQNYLYKLSHAILKTYDGECIPVLGEAYHSSTKASINSPKNSSLQEMVHAC